MVGKLLKYEFIRTRSAIALSGLGVLLVGLVGYGLSFVSPTVATFPFFLGFFLAVVFTFGIQIYLAVEFYRSSFGRRGYLTHALPVKPSTLVLTKLLYALIVCVVALAWSVGVLMISLLTAEKLGIVSWDQFWVMFDAAVGQVPWMVGFLVANVVLTVLVTMTQYYFSVAFGSESWISKAGGLGPVLVFVLSYVAFQFVALLALVIPPSVSPFTGNWSWGLPIAEMLQDSETAGVPISVVWIALLVAVFFVWRTVVSVSRKLELR